MNLTEGFWDNKYKNNKIGWDLGEISPPLKTYFNQLKNKQIKILIPGGGNSYEAEYLFNKGFTNVFVVDLSITALNNIKKRVPSFPSSQLIHANFFDLNITFDLVIEQTFFCAIDPDLRKNYASKIKDLLIEKGKLVGLLFNAKLNEDHPPFGGHKKEYLEIFKPYFDIKLMEEAYNSIKSRQGLELFFQVQKKE
ncbi:TPMT family class I SAM-dependent methyltransferase [Polaribacter sp. MSW13]|uniref:TPMT family class I SAM-dependent methyltransferase n=1 Tax=Polaribacter marinus TaxID=2916838 RepID=A0A9X2AJ00_9FLAO|nr:TPMT family class I SAM-dependent methyltransferase [Polaribacter marinus]MCI2228582.1 TPMT family class I SAM-dependent methyltransferase [Polaribacter marinus]